MVLLLQADHFALLPLGRRSQNVVNSGIQLVQPIIYFAKCVFGGLKDFLFLVPVLPAFLSFFEDSSLFSHLYRLPPNIRGLVELLL